MPEVMIAFDDISSVRAPLADCTKLLAAQLGRVFSID
jgi:hypothetical protein